MSVIEIRIVAFWGVYWGPPHRETALCLRLSAVLLSDTVRPFGFRMISVVEARSFALPLSLRCSKPWTARSPERSSVNSGPVGCDARNVLLHLGLHSTH